MLMEGIKIGLAVTGSFCTLNSFIPWIGKLAEEGADVTPIISGTAASSSNKFSTGDGRREILEGITGRRPIESIEDAEPIGPNAPFDILVVAPCTGNTLAKLSCGITDTPVTMAVKAHLRNNLPVVIGISTNDGLGANAKNLGLMLNTKHFYFIPFYQDDPVKKPKSIIFHNELLIKTIQMALEGKQLQPLLSMAKAIDDLTLCS